MKKVFPIAVVWLLFVLAFNFAVYFLFGCGPYQGETLVRWDCDELAVPEGLQCPSTAMRIQESIMLMAYEREFGELSEGERICATRYWYAEYPDRASIYEACWPGVAGCALYRPGQVSTIKVWSYPDRDAFFIMQRHEVLHLILWCSGQPGSGDHSHPAFEGSLPEDPSGTLLDLYYDNRQDAGGTL